MGGFDGDKTRRDALSRSATESQQDESTTEVRAAYSVFSKRHSVLVIVLVSVAGFFSPFTAFVYFPALRSIASDFAVSIQLMNITVTVYLIMQGIIPSVLGDLSESVGRRPVYLIAFSIYCAASVGLAFQRNYTALLLLRMLQSAGSSGAIALAYGVIGDLAAPHERGIYVGSSHIGFNAAPALGPVVGGLITTKAGWPWIFVFLAAFSGTLLILLALFLPETSRSIVGNGSIPARGFNKTLLQYLLHPRSTTPHENERRLRLPNILPCLKLVFHKHTFPVLLSNAAFYTMYSCLQASLAPLFQRTCGLSALEAGLCYLSYGIAGGVASYAIGLITDRDYRITAEKNNLPIDRLQGDDVLRFPIEQARLRTMWIYISICASSVIGYGWTLSARSPVSVPIILNFITGFTVTGVFNVCNTLMVDLHPSYPVTASASVSVTRCFCAAGGVAVIELLLNALGPGWTFTIVGGLCLATAPLLWMVQRWGWGWRIGRAERG